jgi:hypothetical protein
MLMTPEKSNQYDDILIIPGDLIRTGSIYSQEVLSAQSPEGMPLIQLTSILDAATQNYSMNATMCIPDEKPLWINFPSPHPNEVRRLKQLQTAYDKLVFEKIRQIQANTSFVKIDGLNTLHANNAKIAHPFEWLISKKYPTKIHELQVSILKVLPEGESSLIEELRNSFKGIIKDQIDTIGDTFIIEIEGLLQKRDQQQFERQTRSMLMTKIRRSPVHRQELLIKAMDSKTERDLITGLKLYLTVLTAASIQSNNAAHPSSAGMARPR